MGSYMMSDQQYCAIVHRGQESRDFDYKGPCSWSESGKKACCELTKDILAMANTAGGTIVIGVAEVNHQYVFTGLQAEQANTWETTRLNNFVNSYADPPVNCTLRHVECDGRLFVAIQVPSFAFAPHITAKEFPGTLAKATLYIRTANNASAPISDPIDLNTVIERAIKVRRGEMINTVLIVLHDLESAITSKAGSNVTERERTQVMQRAERASPVLRGAQILWVDDHPDNNLHERRLLRSLGVFVDLARSTEEAISMLANTRYDMVISDMERDGIQDEGVKFLLRARSLGLHRPTVFYLSRVDESRGLPLYAFGIAARPDHLLHYIMDVLERERG